MTLVPQHVPERVAYVAETVVADLVPGDVYSFRGFRNATGGWSAPPGRYRLIGPARHVHSHAELVVFVGVGGEDDGKIYACSLEDWVRNFDPPARPEPPPPEAAPDPGVRRLEDRRKALRDMAQKHADAIGLPVLLVLHPSPSPINQSARMPYFVPEVDALPEDKDTQPPPERFEPRATAGKAGG